MFIKVCLKCLLLVPGTRRPPWWPDWSNVIIILILNRSLQYIHIHRHHKVVLLPYYYQRIMCNCTVDKSERENGNNPEKELLNAGFQGYTRP